MNAGDAGDLASERYRACTDFPRFALGNNQELVYSLLTRTAVIPPAVGVQFLQACRGFATLADHATRLCRDLGLALDQAEPLRQQLLGLARAGLLVAHGDLLRHCQRHAAADGTARIAAVGIPTRNRTASLQRCLGSYLDSGRQAGRSNEFIVVDDSDGDAARQDNRRLLQAFQAQYGVALGYAGPEQKERFAAALAREAGVAPEVTAFALGNPENCPIATGASRNALLLHTAGDLLLQADDDTVCNLAPAPEPQPGLRFCSRHDPTEFWFLADDEAEPAGQAADLLAVHEQLLGRSPGACLAALPSAADLDLEQASTGFFRRLEAPGARVRVTAAGVSGDSGMGSSVYFLSLDGGSRARLLRSEQVYRQALARHRILRVAPRLTLCDGGFCMALNLGLDNRGVLPPFLPVQRNQDGVFTALVRSCLDGAFFGFLPWMVRHQSPAPRRFTPADLATTVATVTTGQVFLALLQSIVPAPHPEDGGKLREVGRTLFSWGAAAAGDFEEVMRLQLWQQMSRQATHFEARLRQFGGQPAYWAGDVQQLLGALRHALPGPDYPVPRDLAERFGTAGARALLQRLVRRFGELLQVWPDLVAAAKALRGRGVRLAGPA
jgi:hypothetical protein